MFNHEPTNYQCPFCLIAKGIENNNVITKQTDVLYHDNDITAFISSHWWPNNPGHVIIIPNKHIENIYTLPDDLSDKIHRFEKVISIALKRVYQCDGVSSRQHNEPAGGQDVWHYHLHVFPRYLDDNLYIRHKEKHQTEQQDRTIYSGKMQDYFKDLKFD